ncbi:calcium-dependent phosphotriesterase, partial [Sistotremastrum niveocremeum HHB9708]
MALRCFGIFTAVLVAIGGAYYQLSLKSTLEKAGLWRQITNIGTENCRQVKGLEACEKLLLHQPSGILYLACSSIENRLAWTPALDHLNASAVLPDKDYIATYDPSSNKITHLKIKGMTDPRLSVHGMDAVPSSKSPAELWFYVVNHRVPKDGKDPLEVGADSVVEIFKGGVGSSVLEWVKTVESEHLHTPNDVAGDPDGKAFYFTNDNYAKRGWKRQLQIPLGFKQTSVGYCHVDEGCRIVAPNLPAANGITRAQDGTYYVASVLAKVIALERQTDNSMILGDIIEAG